MLVKTHQFSPEDETLAKRLFVIGFVLPILWVVNILYFKERITMGLKTFHTSAYLAHFTKDTEQPNRFLLIQSYVFYSKIAATVVFLTWFLWIAFFQWKTSDIFASDAWLRWAMFSFSPPNPYDRLEDIIPT